jgi:hypothetical protein
MLWLWGRRILPTDFLGTGDLVGGKIISAPWGREIDFVASGAGTNQVDIYGRDYLGQPVHKQYALNGATRVPGGVALKWLDRIVVAAGGAITVSVGYTNRLGLEYRTIAVITEFLDLVKSAAAGTLDGPNITDPQTVTVPGISSDPRGLYTPNGTDRWCEATSGSKPSSSLWSTSMGMVVSTASNTLGPESPE